MTLSRHLRTLLVLVLLAATAASALYWLQHTTHAVRAEARDKFYEQYNRQQLLLAEVAARSVEEVFDTFRQNLSLVVSLFAPGAVTRERVEAVTPILQKIFASLADTPVIDLVIFDAAGTVVGIHPGDSYTLGRGYAWRDYYRWARDEGAPERMYVSPFMGLEGGQHRGDLALIVAEGIYGENGAFQGVAAFTLNFDELARKHILSVRIGVHGYAWLADIHNRTVLVDPHGTVAGRSFDEAFLPRWQPLYELLLSTADGKPGVGWYDFEDPADPSRPVRKLVGFRPVHIEGRLWTLGVATPQREVDALLSSFLRRQETFSTTLIAAILAGTLALGALLTTWNRLLSQRVAVRTRDLAEARARLEDAFEELLAARKLAAVGQLAVGLTHEIRNPLSAIRMNMQMIRKRFQPRGADTENFAIVEEEILRLNRLLTDVMGFARPRPLRLEETDLEALLGRVLQLQERNLKTRGIGTEVRIDGPLWTVCDPEQIQQVFLNLVLNAAESMETSPAPKRLTVAARRDGESIRLRVSDTGAGVPPEDRDKIFDLFYTTKASGGGLGLSTVQSIVLRHGGGVELVDALGPGATFAIRLPVQGPARSNGSSP